jgi:hypothetical protein
MMKLHLAAAGAAALLSASAAAQAAVIEVNAGVFDAAIAAYQPIGQSFTAIDPTLLSIGFAYSDINPGAANTEVTIDLFEGEGFGGPLVASRSFFLPAVLPTTSQPPVIFDTDFSGVGLSVGGTYTAALGVAGNSFKVAAVHGFDSYAGGQGLGGACADCDFNFRVVGEGFSGAVPEPGAWALMITGFGLAGAALRRRPSAGLAR